MKSNYTRVRPPRLRSTETPAGGFVGRGGALNDKKKSLKDHKKWSALKRYLGKIFPIKDYEEWRFKDNSRTIVGIVHILGKAEGPYTGVSAFEPNNSVICQRIFVKFKMQIF
jgi:hypothetical protein